MKQPKNIFRKPKNGEQIIYDCGCVYIINVKKDETGFTAYPDLFCFEHDPTINNKAKEFGEENIDWSLV